MLLKMYIRQVFLYRYIKLSTLHRSQIYVI